MPASEQQMAQQAAPVAVAAPESRASTEQPRPAEPMSVDNTMRLRGGGEGEVRRLLRRLCRPVLLRVLRMLLLLIPAGALDPSSSAW
ncbi:hypothetical protein E4U42_005602 [Claviceps africana]|uniref:Uncharacterized protein n=1 Tax=Claviceps africana TaxID=83212 RepID=A0A8K0NG97_9HYPO|nr:hypothetical protein E4U42_005602 [Claviceps africana]